MALEGVQYMVREMVISVAVLRIVPVGNQHSMVAVAFVFALDFDDDDDDDDDIDF
jgi:hypothetical protein